MIGKPFYTIISSSFPDGVYFDEKSGKISGRFRNDFFTSIYAKNDYGIFFYEFRINVIKNVHDDCKRENKSLIYFYFEGKECQDRVNIELENSLHELEFSYTYDKRIGSYYYAVRCLEQNDYSLILHDYSKKGWCSSYIRVTFNYKFIGKYTMYKGEYIKKINLNSILL